jgi:hypothetical protein
MRKNLKWSKEYKNSNIRRAQMRSFSARKSILLINSYREEVFNLNINFQKKCSQ